MARAAIRFLSDAERTLIHEQTLAVLEEVGIAFNTAMAIDLLEEAGAPVDRQALTARLPRELVARCLEVRAGQGAARRPRSRPTTYGWVTAA